MNARSQSRAEGRRQIGRILAEAAASPTEIDQRGMDGRYGRSETAGTSSPLHVFNSRELLHSGMDRRGVPESPAKGLLREDKNRRAETAPRRWNAGKASGHCCAAWSRTRPYASGEIPQRAAGPGGAPR